MFYAEVKKRNGELKSRSSMLSIRFVLKCFFQSSSEYDIINTEFKIVEWDVQSCAYKHLNAPERDPWCTKKSLTKRTSQSCIAAIFWIERQYKVFLDFMFYTCRRGRGNQREMEVTDFVLKFDGQRRRYFQKGAQYMKQKYNRGSETNNDDLVCKSLWDPR